MYTANVRVAAVYKYIYSVIYAEESKDSLQYLCRQLGCSEVRPLARCGL